ncbi:MAG TPA: glycosyltransferase family 4 protein [Longimicrobiales bacterium]|nr:glycosyltransferase family 4 protein [Longimicrobiales bacterium]
MSPSAPRRVLFVTACTGKGGAGNSLALLLRHLDRSRIEPVVVMPGQGVIGERLHRLGIRTVFAPRLRERTWELRFRTNNVVTRGLSALWNLSDSVIFTFQLAGLARSLRCELIYANHMMVKIIAVVAGALSGRRVVLHTRTIYANAPERWLYTAFAALPHVKRIVAVSWASAANFRAIPQKVRVVHNGVPLDELPDPETRGTLRRELGIPAEAQVVGFVGRLVAWKGVDVFLDAAVRLAAADAEVRFIVVGAAPVGSTARSMDDFRAQAVARGLGGRIWFTGFRKDAAACVIDFDVLVTPSVRPDPCPRVVLEALAVGTPVVGSASGGIAETVQDGVTGFLARPGDAADVADKVGRVLSDPALKAALGREAMRAMRRDHSAESVAARIQAIVLDALDDGGATG